MRTYLGPLLMIAALAAPGHASAGGLENAFYALTPVLREYVQIRLRQPGLYKNAVDGQFGPSTATAILAAKATPGFRLYRASAQKRGLQDEHKIAVYYVLSDHYEQFVIRR